MKRIGFYAALPVIVALVLFTASFSQSNSTPSGGSTPIGAANIAVGDAEVTDGGLDVRAFVPTGSLSTNCLATLAESNFAIPGLSVFCAPRQFHGQEGLLFSVFSPQPIPTGLILSATVYQEHAHGYGPPVLYTGN
jgi:hypothetical protein